MSKTRVKSPYPNPLPKWEGSDMPANKNDMSLCSSVKTTCIYVKNTGRTKKTITISRYITKLLLTLHHQKLVLRTTNAQLLKEHIIQKH